MTGALNIYKSSGYKIRNHNRAKYITACLLHFGCPLRGSTVTDPSPGGVGSLPANDIPGSDTRIAALYKLFSVHK